MEIDYLKICSDKAAKYCKGLSKESLYVISENTHIVLRRLMDDGRFIHLTFESLLNLAIKTANFHYRASHITYTIEVFYDKVLYMFSNYGPSYEDVLFEITKAK